eukprot:m.266132 g.266132  ORF g.266132 m.266132 type:complete len:272 (-) comp65576_c0_seq1:214-1029(-)
MSDSEDVHLLHTETEKQAPFWSTTSSSNKRSRQHHGGLRSKCSSRCCCCCHSRAGVCFCGGLYVIGALVLVGAMFAVPAWLCCSLFLEPPSITLNPATLRPAGFHPDVTKLEITFSIALDLALDNPNYIGATVHSAMLHAWYLSSDNPVPALQSSYLGVVETRGKVDVRPRANTTLQVTANFVSTVLGSAILANVVTECAQPTPDIHLRLNLTDVDASFGAINFELSDIVFDVHIGSCINVNVNNNTPHTPTQTQLMAITTASQSTNNRPQ